MKKVLQALSLFKSVHFRSVLFLSILLIPIACQKQFSVEKPNILSNQMQAQLISDAKKHFEDHVQNTASSSLRKKFKTKSDMHKKPNWKKAFVTSGHKKDIVVTPVDYDSSLFVRNQGYIYSVNSLSYLSSYKDSTGNMQTQLLTIVPDSSFSSLNIKKQALSSSFSGIMTIEDWSGKYLGGLLYKEGKITNVSDHNEDKPNITGRTEVSACSTMDWYSCASSAADVASNPFGDPTADSRCSYNYSTSDCSGSSYFSIYNGWYQDFIPIRITYPTPVGGGGGSGSGVSPSRFPPNPKVGDRVVLSRFGANVAYAYRCYDSYCDWFDERYDLAAVNVKQWVSPEIFKSFPVTGDMAVDYDENVIFTYDASTTTWVGVHTAYKTINSSNLKPCMQAILYKVLNLSNGSVAGIIQKFKNNYVDIGQKPTIPAIHQQIKELGYNWILQDGSLNGPTGQTSGLYDKNQYTTTTTFDSHKYPYATDLSWARTILHESIHAYFVTKFALDRPDYIGTYPQMVQDYGNFGNWMPTHHEEFARSLVTSIADALQEYGNNQGYKLTRQFYEDLSWGGLDQTTTFKNLSTDDQKRILNVGAIELTGNDMELNYSRQKGTNAGCK